MEVIILAGGKGSRLQSVVSDTPKCLADINGKPFLEYLINYLEEQGVHHIILSLGYKYDQVIEWLKNKAFLCKISWVIEREPLGTGGGIRLALQKSKEKLVAVINGDTYFPINLMDAFSENLDDKKALICLKNMKNPDRYGTVLLNKHNEIISFEEKRIIPEGLINAGIYILNKDNLNFTDMPESFSFEKDFLEKNTGKHLKGKVYDEYFIDIGIPEDYEAFQKHNK